MSMLARAVARAVAVVIVDGDVRARYREQWLADIDGAAELGLRPGRIAFGAAISAVRLSVAHPVLFLPDVGARGRRVLGIVQIVLVVPHLWALLLCAYAAVHFGRPPAEAFTHDPKDMIGDWTPVYLLHGLSLVWLAVHGWLVTALLAPVALLMSWGGKGWLLRVGALAGFAVVALALTDFGAALRVWMLD
jgi:hypothetical protein